MENFRRSRKGRRDKKGLELNDIENVDEALIELSTFLDDKLLKRRKMMMAVRIIELNSKILSRNVRAASAERGFLSMPPDLSILYKTPRSEHRK